MKRITELGTLAVAIVLLCVPAAGHWASGVARAAESVAPPLVVDALSEPAVLADLPSASPTETADSREAEVIRERYPNSRVKIRREVAQDEEGNYLNHGPWKKWDSRGNLIAEGQYDMGQRVGRWTRWMLRNDSQLFAKPPFNQSEGHFISQATFENGLLHGEWVIYDAERRKLSRVTFQDGQRHGPTTLWLPNGNIMQDVTYRNGALHGDAREMGPEGKPVIVATYQDGRRLAKKVTRYKNGKATKDEALYLFAKLIPKAYDDFWNAQFATYESVGDDERHGRWITRYPNGQIMVEGHFENDEPVGRFAWWYANGQKMTEGLYRNGKQHGTWTWWHSNGQKATQGQFTEGEQAGKWLTWDEKGKLDQHAVFGQSRLAPPTGIAKDLAAPLRAPRR